jgi:hypothetical protein
VAVPSVGHHTGSLRALCCCLDDRFQLVRHSLGVRLCAQLTRQRPSFCGPALQALHVGILHRSSAAARGDHIFRLLAVQAYSALKVAVHRYLTFDICKPDRKLSGCFLHAVDYRSDIYTFRQRAGVIRT